MLRWLGYAFLITFGLALGFSMGYAFVIVFLQ